MVTDRVSDIESSKEQLQERENGSQDYSIDRKDAVVKTQSEVDSIVKRYINDDT